MPLGEGLVGEDHLIPDTRVVVARLVGIDQEGHVVGQRLLHMLTREIHYPLGGGS
jgi:hypothetical protein